MPNTAIQPASPTFSSDKIAALITLYEEQAARFLHEVAGLTPVQLAAHPIPGTWSIAQIVTHLCDSELAFAERMKRIIAEEDNHPLQSWDENRWMTHLATQRGPTSETGELLTLLRRQMVWILREQPQEAFSRSGVHSQLGPITLFQVLEKATWHFDHHLKFLREKRALV